MQESSHCDSWPQSISGTHVQREQATQKASHRKPRAVQVGLRQWRGKMGSRGFPGPINHSSLLSHMPFLSPHSCGPLPTPSSSHLGSHESPINCSMLPISHLPNKPFTPLPEASLKSASLIKSGSLHGNFPLHFVGNLTKP